MALRITQVDAFTDRPFAGNPAAVCIMPAARDAAWMQNVAREMNLSETAFLVRRDGAFHLRWFTPVTEVDLCGHATLASAHVLWEDGHLNPDEPARFDTLSGRLEAHRGDDWIEMDFPAEAPREIAAPPPEHLIGALGGIAPEWIGANRLDYLVALHREADVRSLRPDFYAIRRLGMRGVIVTAPAEPGRDYDFVSRYFAPLFGVDEDPVTGSAHCCLGPFWAARLGREELIGFQASARGGTVVVRPAGARVRLWGQAVTVMRGTLTDAALETDLMPT